MPPLVPRALGRRPLAVALVALAAVVPCALAAPADDVVLLTEEDAQLERQAEAIAGRLDARRAELARARGELDLAQADYEAALAEVTLRLEEIYRAGEAEIDPGVFTGDVDALAARAELLEAVSRQDGELLVRLRLAILKRDTAEADLDSRKQHLQQDADDLDAKRAALQVRIDAAKAISQAGPGETPSAPVAPPFTTPLSVATSLGLPFRPPVTYRANERGLPAYVVAKRSLPGVFAYDPATGQVDFGDPAPTATKAPEPKVPATPASFTAVASWYGTTLEGQATASGEKFDPRALTAAHRTLPFGTWLRVTYRDRMVVVRVTDRGPYVEGRDIDLSPGAAELLGLALSDTVHVDVVTGPAG